MRVAALDAIEALRPPVDVVKIDVQGAEEGVVRGMRSLLSRSPDVLVTLEFWPAGARQFGSDPESLLGYYRSLGFEIRVQLPDEKGLLDLNDAESSPNTIFPSLGLEQGHFENAVPTRTGSVSCRANYLPMRI